MWEPGLPAMQSPRSFSNTWVMLSQASQLPQLDWVTTSAHHSTGSLTGLAMIAFSSLVIGNSRFKPLGGIGCSNQRW